MDHGSHGPCDSNTQEHVDGVAIFIDCFACVCARVPFECPVDIQNHETKVTQCMNPRPDLDWFSIMIPFNPHRSIPDRLDSAVIMGRLAFDNINIVWLGNKLWSLTFKLFCDHFLSAPSAFF